MNKKNLQLVGLLLTVLGITLIVGGAIAASYNEVTDYYFFSYQAYPYSQYALALIIPGIICMMIGLVLLVMARRASLRLPEYAQPFPPPPPPP